ncbi:MAG: toxin-antitoxin system TumE family protein [Promethearchaeota archaeon]
MLKTSQLVTDFEMLDYKDGDDFYYLKIRAILKDGSVLFLKEYGSPEGLSYSYHWQSPEGEMIRRWDNAPHHQEISSSPHHVHTPGVEKSPIVDCEGLLEEIGKILALSSSKE